MKKDELLARWIELAKYKCPNCNTPMLPEFSFLPESASWQIKGSIFMQHQCLFCDKKVVEIIKRDSFKV